VTQQCPCPPPSRSRWHGKADARHLVCVARETRELVRAGEMTRRERGAWIANARRECKPPRKGRGRD
jgi:hypothetical protein